MRTQAFRAALAALKRLPVERLYVDQETAESARIQRVLVVPHGQSRGMGIYASIYNYGLKTTLDIGPCVIRTSHGEPHTVEKANWSFWALYASTPYPENDFELMKVGYADTIVLLRGLFPDVEITSDRLKSFFAEWHTYRKVNEIEVTEVHEF
jgi:hypothetical protein